MFVFSTVILDFGNKNFIFAKFSAFTGHAYLIKTDFCVAAKSKLHYGNRMVSAAKKSSHVEQIMQVPVEEIGSVVDIPRSVSYSLCLQQSC